MKHHVWRKYRGPSQRPETILEAAQKAHARFRNDAQRYDRAMGIGFLLGLSVPVAAAVLYAFCELVGLL